jgi:(p)ppGpp synthase/HD superfamily hydrolase
MSHQTSTLKRKAQIKRITDADRSRGLEEMIEILEAQVERLDLEQCYKNQELEEMQQELRYANQGLCTEINSAPLTLEQTEELARKFLATEKPLNDALVELLAAIYNVPVDPEILAQPDSCFTNWYSEIEVEDAA